MTIVYAFSFDGYYFNDARNDGRKKACLSRDFLGDWLVAPRGSRLALLMSGALDTSVWLLTQ